MEFVPTLLPLLPPCEGQPSVIYIPPRWNRYRDSDSPVPKTAIIEGRADLYQYAVYSQGVRSLPPPCPSLRRDTYH